MRGAVGARSSLGSGMQSCIRSNILLGHVGFVQGDSHDVFGYALDLDVHLHGGDAFPGARALEVHVAQVVFQVHDIGEHHIVVAFHDQAVGDARHRSFDGTPAAIIARQPLQMEAIDEEPFDSRVSATTRMV